MTELVDDNGPITETTRIYGKRNGTPSSFEATLLYDFIKARTDTLYPTQGQLSSLDDYVSAFTLQKNSSDNTKWDGQSLIARGFADGVEDDDLATVGQITALSSAVTIGTTVINNGTTSRVLYNNNGVAGEYELSGTGKVLMDTNPVVTSALTLGTQQATQGSLVLANTAAGAYPVTLLSSNSTAAAWSLTFPTTAGTNGQALTTNGSGVTTWTSIVTSPGGSSGQLQYNNSSAFGGANFYVESANLLAQRNSTTAQGNRIYNSYTDGSNGEWLSLDWTATANTASILTVKNGSGTQRALEIGASGAANWRITTSGHLVGITDNTYDLGATGATRPRTGYFGTSVVSPVFTASTSITTPLLTITQGTITADAPQINGSVTWNNAGVTFTGWKFNVVSDTSAAFSLLMDLQVAGSSKFKVDKNGFVTGGGVYSANAAFVALTNNGGDDIRLFANAWYPSSTNIDLGQGTANNFRNIYAKNSFGLGSSADVFLFRDAANTLALRNSTSAQTFNLYKTYTDGSNYSRAYLSPGLSGNTFVIGTEAAGTGTAGDIGIAAGGGSGNWTFKTAGHFIANSDNAYDLGASGANRPRTGYFGTSVVAPLATITQGTITADAPQINGTVTWNNSGVTFTGWKLNVTATASAALSMIADFQVGSSSAISLGFSGSNGGSPTLWLGQTSPSLTNFVLKNFASNIYLNAASGQNVQVSVNNSPVVLVSDTQVRFASVNAFGWTASAVSAALDTILTRAAAATLQHGAADAAAPVAQTISFQSVVAGTSNTAGVNATRIQSLSTGTGVAGNFIYQAGFSLAAAGANTVTMTIATPAVMTLASHGFVTGTPVVFTTTGALPTGITSGTTYYVVAISGSTSTFNVATSVANAIAGTLVATSGSQSGTHTVTTSATVQNPAITTATWGPSGLTGSQSTSLLALRQTLNTSGTPAVVQLGLTFVNTAVVTSTKVIDYVFNGASTLSIRGDGAINQTDPGYAGYGYTSTFAAWLRNDTVGIAVTSGAGVALKNSQKIGWSSTSNWYDTQDLILVRDAANTLALRNSTAAQTFNVYNTYTDGSNYERLAIQWSSNIMRIKAEKAGTGTDRQIVIAAVAGMFIDSDIQVDLRKTDGTLLFRADAAGNLICGSAALSTSATNGFFYAPASAGAPTGVPASVASGRIPMQFDSTNSKLYAYIGGAWKSVTLA